MKKGSLGYIGILLVLLIIGHGLLFYWAQGQQIRALIEDYGPLWTALEPEKLPSALRQHQGRFLELALFDQNLRLVVGNILPEDLTFREDLLFARNQRARVYNLWKGYEIVPLGPYLLVLRLRGGWAYFWRFWWPEFLFLLLIGGALLWWWHKRGGYIQGSLNQCQEFLLRFLDLEEDLPLEEILQRAAQKVQKWQEQQLEKERVIKQLEQEVNRLKRALRKTQQDLESTQESLLQAGSLMALGEFAAGISHELNNPLGIVLGFTQYLLDEIPPDHPHYAKLKRMETELERAQKIIQDLLAFARPGEPQKQWTDINQLVKETLQLVMYPPVEGVKVETELDPHLPKAYVDPDQLEQVLINLFKNALEAMPQGGTLRVRTGTTPLQPEDCFALSLPLVQPSNLLLEDRDPSRRLPKTESYTPGQKAIYIDVSDTGTGIAKENLQKIFTPFFTTKKKGTGLGLSICWKLIRRNGGLLKVESTPGEGTTFRIILPVKESSNVSAGKDSHR